MWMATEGIAETTTFKGHREVGQAFPPWLDLSLERAIINCGFYSQCHKNVKLGRAKKCFRNRIYINNLYYNLTHQKALPNC